MLGTLRRVLVISVFLIGLSTSMTSALEVKIEGDAAALAQSFIQQHEQTVRPLEREAALAWWNANVSGKALDFKAKEDAQNRLDAALSDHSASIGSKRSKKPSRPMPNWDARSMSSI